MVTSNVTSAALVLTHVDVTVRPKNIMVTTNAMSAVLDPALILVDHTEILMRNVKWHQLAVNENILIANLRDNVIFNRTERIKRFLPAAQVLAAALKTSPRNIIVNPTVLRERIKTNMIRNIRNMSLLRAVQAAQVPVAAAVLRTSLQSISANLIALG